MELYELKRNKTRYQNMRENVVRMINILSSSNLSDQLFSSSRSLEENYLLNDNSVKSPELRAIKNSLDSDVTKLRNLLNSIDIKIRELNKKILDSEIN